MENSKNPLQTNPLKLFIQDVHSCSLDEVKYVYRFKNMRFKNIHIHGVILELTHASGYYEFLLSDPTASIRVIYNKTKSNNTLSSVYLQSLCKEFEEKVKPDNPHHSSLNLLKNRIVEKSKIDIPEFHVGDCVSVIGDIFIDVIKENRKVSAYKCVKSTNLNDVFWLDRLSYIYSNYYNAKHEGN